MLFTLTIFNNKVKMFEYFYYKVLFIEKILDYLYLITFLNLNLLL